MSGFNPRGYWETRLAQNPGLAGVGFIGLGRYYNQWLYRVRRYVLTRQVRALPLDLQTATILDVGSGTGFYVDAWKRLGAPRVIGCDITDTSVGELRRRFPSGEFHKVDIGDDLGPLAGCRFDIVSAFDVLFHIVDDRAFEQAMKNIHSILRPGGLFIFSDNFLHGTTARGVHQVSRSLEDIKRLVDETGFEVLERTPMFFLMNAPLDSQNRLQWTLWNHLTRAVGASELAGFLIGAVLFPFEVACVSLKSESPSTEMLVCRSRGRAEGVVGAADPPGKPDSRSTVK